MRVVVDDENAQPVEANAVHATPSANRAREAETTGSPLMAYEVALILAKKKLIQELFGKDSFIQIATGIE
jgi:hypothetical protein